MFEYYIVLKKVLNKQFETYVYQYEYDKNDSAYEKIAVIYCCCFNYSSM